MNAAHNLTSESANEERHSDVVNTGYRKCAASVSNAVQVTTGDKEAPPERTCELSSKTEVEDDPDRWFTIERLTP